MTKGVAYRKIFRCTDKDQIRNFGRYETKLTLNLLTTTIVAPPGNASKWQMVFNSVFKGLIINCLTEEN